MESETNQNSSFSSSRNDLYLMDDPRPPSNPQNNLSTITRIQQASPRTSSFFDVTNLTASPPPPLRLSTGNEDAPGPSSSAPSSLDLSRAATCHDLSPDVSSPVFSTPGQDESISPLHQSPTLPRPLPAPSWRPPLPAPAAQVDMRFEPSPSHLLGEGRYSTVYLSSFRRKSRGRSRASYERPPSQYSDNSINAEGDGFVGGSWRLCAAKRMQADRESQTMGLREAFFLDRLANKRLGHGVTGLSERPRAVSPLRHTSKRSSSDDLCGYAKSRGCVYIIKLIATMEDNAGTGAPSGHGRSASDALEPLGYNRTVTRQRSSTFISSTVPRKSVLDQGASASYQTDHSSHSQAARQEVHAVSRLVLLLEHAPLGTLDRLLRNSPHLAGKNLWHRWAREGTSALEWVHAKGIIHADVKPGNILVTADLHLRLSDFGSSLLVHPSHPPIDGLGLGTLPFSPPELVDPNQSFSFPVDIFSLGATLYQCITGREPYRGTKTVEMMHHVRKGSLWVREEQRRLERVGTIHEDPMGSPFPSAWRGDSAAGVRRTGSLRAEIKSYSELRLPKKQSTDSMRASTDIIVADPNKPHSPAAVRAWVNWSNNAISAPGTDVISRLLAEENLPSPIATTPTTEAYMLSPIFVEPTKDSHSGTADLGDLTSPHADGSPVMLYLDGSTRVDEAVRDVIKSMVDPRAAARPTAADVYRKLIQLSGEDDEEELA